MTRAVDQAERDQAFMSISRRSFENAKSISTDHTVIDYATARLAVIPVAFGWSDVGSWRTVWKLPGTDSHGNAKIRGLTLRTQNWRLD
jgi:mannose-1-phosphate guanylyltransferase/mannose-6-phosphate isomerase